MWFYYLSVSSRKMEVSEPKCKTADAFRYMDDENYFVKFLHVIGVIATILPINTDCFICWGSLILFCEFHHSDTINVLMVTSSRFGGKWVQINVNSGHLENVSAWLLSLRPGLELTWWEAGSQTSNNYHLVYIWPSIARKGMFKNKKKLPF